MLSSIFVCLALQTACFVSANDNYQEVLQRLSNLEKEVSFLREKLKSCQGGSQISDVIDQSRKKRIVPQGQQSQVAFHAHLSQNQINLGVHQAIHFDKVLLNEGNGYSVHAGEFVAPISGLYVFAWSIASGDRSCMKYEFVHNSAVLTYSISDAHDHDDWAVSSGTAVTRMNSGDRVWIRVSDMLPCSHTIFGVGLGTSSFSGFLLH
ncbi:heavy metal-binding protein HIP-like [Saccostrea echinata]|uniref:heavy metal-binding protein HIP-like n=1 Tax=Saccostrea echinata TaxID=191078 RepID=UPI002A7FA10D|nr:heavy metal-binding protein HIP-like [Saccostrea echinata]